MRLQGWKDLYHVKNFIIWSNYNMIHFNPDKLHSTDHLLSLCRHRIQLNSRASLKEFRNWCPCWCWGVCYCLEDRASVVCFSLLRIWQMKTAKWYNHSLYSWMDKTSSRNTPENQNWNKISRRSTVVIEHLFWGCFIHSVEIDRFAIKDWRFLNQLWSK